MCIVIDENMGLVPRGKNAFLRINLLLVLILSLVFTSSVFAGGRVKVVDRHVTTNGNVNLEDFSGLSYNWLDIYDMNTLIKIAEDWLK